MSPLVCAVSAAGSRDFPRPLVFILRYRPQLLSVTWEPLLFDAKIYAASKKICSDPGARLPDYALGADSA
jgi:hypothetical protein